MNLSVVSRPEAALFRCGVEARPVAGQAAAFEGLDGEGRLARRGTTYKRALSVGAAAE